tara:strand:+ start:3705 stop:6602 length:2898 start_codon:yes stop_codon:yes gene_type:complete
MKLLEKFRSSPEWQSKDPVERVTAVRSMSTFNDNQELLIEVALGDEDPSVRMEAVLRLGDVDALVSVIRNDSDIGVRDEAEAVLSDLMIETDDASVARPDVYEVLTDTKLVTIARSARLESVSKLALAALTTQRSIGSVARGAAWNKVAAEALSKLDAPEEILAVAMKSEDKAVATRAFERLTDSDLSRDVLENLAKRAKQKIVRRRANVEIGALDQVAVTPALHLEHLSVCEEVEAIAAASSLDRGQESLQRLLAQWSSLDSTTDPMIVKRFTRARAGAESRLAEIEAIQSAEQRLKQRRTQLIVDAGALCQKIESLSGVERQENVEELHQKWLLLTKESTVEVDDVQDDPASITGQMAALDERFRRGLDKFEERRREIQDFYLRLKKVEKIVVEMESLGEGLDDSNTERWGQLVAVLDSYIPAKTSKSWRLFAPLSAGDDAMDAVVGLRQRYMAVKAGRQAFFAKEKTKKTKAEQENVSRLIQRCQTVEGLVLSDKLILKEAERQLRSISRLIDDPGPIPRRDKEALIRQLRRARSGMLGRVRELRDFADWHRWANLGIQEEVCRSMERLGHATDVDEADLASQFQALMERWRQASDVPKNRRQELLDRFKIAYDVVFPRCQTFMETEAALREQNLIRQRAIVKECEGLKKSTDWLKTAKKIKELQNEWKQLKPVPQRQQKELWGRFRSASNTFFDHRKKDLSKRKKEWARNLELKESLCDHVSTLIQVDNIDEALTATKKAQAEWKTIGPVRRNKSDAVWKRFRNSCDAVFDRRHQEQRAEFAEKSAVREVLCVEVESMLSVPVDDMVEKTRQLQQRWRQAPEIPLEFSRKLTARFGQALTRLSEAYPDRFRGTDLDPERKLTRLVKLCERVEALKPQDSSASDVASPAEILATKWRDALASNLMGAPVDAMTERQSAREEVKHAKMDCRRLGTVPGDQGKKLLGRFHAACDEVLEWAESKK